MCGNFPFPKWEINLSSSSFEFEVLKPKSLSTQTKHLGPAGALALKLRLVFVSVTLMSMSDTRGHSRPVPAAQSDVGIGACSSRCSSWSWQPLASGPALGAPRLSVGTGGQCSPFPARRHRACTTPGGSVVLFALLSESSQSLQSSLLLVYDGKCVTTVRLASCILHSVLPGKTPKRVWVGH